MSSSNSPCAACKFLRRKCTQECVFAPYFPPDQPQKFSNVHKVFGASNVSKLLNDLNPSQREDAVNSLAYEAEFRLRDPVYGCVGFISILQHKLKQVQQDLYNAKKELATYVGPSAMLPIFQTHPGFVQLQQQHNSNQSYQILGVQGGPSHGNNNTQLINRETQQMVEAQQLAAVVAAREQQEMMMRSYEQQQNHHHHQQQQQQHEIVRFNGGFDDHQAGPVAAATGFNGGPMSPALALGSFDNSYQIQQQPHDEDTGHQLQLQPQLLLQQQQQEQPATQQNQRSGSVEGRTVFSGSHAS